MGMYSILVHNQKTMTVIGTLCVEAKTAAEATRIGAEVVRAHRAFGTLNGHAKALAAVDASHVRHLDWLVVADPVDPEQVRGRPRPEFVRRQRAAAAQDKKNWWPRLRSWWATRHDQFNYPELPENRTKPWDGMH